MINQIKSNKKMIHKQKITNKFYHKLITAPIAQILMIVIIKVMYKIEKSEEDNQ